jgi:glutamate-ammonia-ligase adenylyltransferase
VLPARESAELLDNYRFLRRTENRLQMEAERQTHRLPRDPRVVERIARGMGFGGEGATAEFERALEERTRRTGEIFAALFPETGSTPILALFVRNAPQLLRHGPSRQVVEVLAEQFGRSIDASTNRERALNNLDRFVRGIGNRRFYYELLIDRPELVPRLTALFAASEYLSGYLATHPRLIEPIFSDPNVLLLSPDEMRTSLDAIRRSIAAEGESDEVEAELDALRLFHNRELINVGLLDLTGKVAPDEAEHSLTHVAEVCLEAGLDLARADMRRRASPPPAVERGEFLVVGMGKLASRELTYGSDLDVIFLYDVPGADEAESLEAQEHYVRLGQKFIWTQQTRTTEGVCYAIDARLRPSGNQGLLVSSLQSFQRYHAVSAQVWERQALLRARPVAGGERLGAAFRALRLEILRRPLADDVGRELHRIRLRTESELARETERRHDFKTGRGGMQDVETVVQLLQLRHGRDHAELLEPDSVGAHLPRLERFGLLSPDDAHTLLEGWSFLQLLSSRLRIIENRSISDLDEERGDLDGIAQRLGYTSPQRQGGARRALLEDYRQRTAAIRDVYRRVLRV